ncbi:NAD(P)/FAD-dependent oxidoreductase [Tumebacillus flagellatus]|uniref:FAD dependent oxidoreductase domain-containing protein n=1 Tax=Tumebacillus flagellatus TaxID=1157490 RepID=A0A074LRW3_9BACL|nr:FAD-dependent oxidoreductase [Tumebacillus flagellatus]KEO82583.1 hypothetical protein EL26_14450 [Tumebacillus flagellatus]
MQTADVVIIGGGVIGAAILHEVARSGLGRAVLLEKSTFGAGSTGKSGGFLRVYHTDSFLSDLAAASFHEFLELRAHIGYVRTGLLMLEKAERVTEMEREVERLTKLGHNLQSLSGSEGAERFGGLEWQGVGGAVYEPDGGYADPVLTTRFWIKEARSRGALASEGTQVLEILHDNGRVTGVRTNRGVIQTSCVVLAAGAWSAELLRPMGIQLPVRSKTIQIHFLMRPEEAVEHPAFLDETTDIYARPDQSGLSLVGLPVDEWDIDPDLSVPADDAVRLRQASAKRLPWSESAWVSGGRRSFDGYTPDGRGLLKPADEVQGLLYAVGWNGGGYKLAPEIARRVVQDIQNRK